MSTLYRLRSDGAKRALSNHKTRTAALTVGKRRAPRAKKPINVDKCLKPKKGPATCEAVAQIQFTERRLKSGKLAKSVRVMTIAKRAPRPAGETEAVLNGARLGRR